MFFLFLAPFLTSVLADTVPSVDTSVTYNCPTRETIDIAYFGYCPNVTPGGANLDSITTTTPYSSAPNNYQTAVDDFELFCEYNNNGNPFTCRFLAGGGETLQEDPDNGLKDCPTAVSPNLPQPSPGVNYRRQQSFGKRSGITPSFVCPFDSSNPDVYVYDVEIDSGAYAQANAAAQSLVASASDIFYGCGISTDVTCFYIQDSDDSVGLAGSLPANAINICPQTLCTAIKTGTYNMRRSTNFKRNISAKQVNTNKLRRRLYDRQSKARLSEPMLSTE